MTERGLVEVAIRGDARAFSALVERYQRVMIASARRMVSNDADAEDLAQEALVEAYRKLPTLQEHGKFRSWLFGILRHKCLDFLRARSEDVHLDDLGYELPAPVADELTDVGELIDRLPIAQRDILVMRYLQELDFREIADELGISEQAVRMRCSRARAQLRALAAERNERQMRKAMAGLLAFPLSHTFTDRVTKEVLTMAQMTAKGKAATGGAAALAWLLGWKGLATIGVVLVVGAGVAVPVVVHNRLANRSAPGNPLANSSKTMAPQQDSAETEALITQSKNNLCQSSVRILMAIQDNHNNYPPMNDANTLAAYLEAHHDRQGVPYLTQAEINTLLTSPLSKKLYKTNASLSGAPISRVGDPDHIVLLYDDFVLPDHTRLAVFCDGHCEHVPESTWPAVMAKSWIN